MQAVEIIKALLAEPYGCPMCDSGKLRNKSKEHWDDCPYLKATNFLIQLPSYTPSPLKHLQEDFTKWWRVNDPATAKFDDYLKFMEQWISRYSPELHPGLGEQGKLNDLRKWIVEQRNTAHINCLEDKKQAYNHVLAHMEGTEPQKCPTCGDLEFPHEPCPLCGQRKKEVYWDGLIC